MWGDFDNYLSQRVLGGSSGASSWNDLTDKPFHYEKNTVPVQTKAGTEISKITKAFSDGNARISYGNEHEFLEVLKTYIVEWDGVKYECFCWGNYDGYYCVGGNAAYGNGWGEIEYTLNTEPTPFVIVNNMLDDEEVIMTAYSYNNNDGTWALESGNTNHIFSVFEIVETLEQLDTKYLKPFETKEIELVNTEIKGTGEGAFYYAEIDGCPLSQATSEVVVTFDGERYVCPTTVDGRYVAFGNTSILDGVIGNGVEPFCVEAKVGSYMTVFILDGANHSISFAEVNSYLHKECMPEYVSELIMCSSEDSEKKFKITVDDSGVITATEITE